MGRFLNLVALTCLIGAAVWVYSIKYDTIYFAEQARKLEHQLTREREIITVLKAEWQLLNQPTRLQALSDRLLDSRPLAATQIITPRELPDRAPKVDSIAQKLDALTTGSIKSILTPGSAKAASTRTPEKR